MTVQEKNIRKSIGKRIKIARTSAKYTQEQLAEKLSLSARYISQLERGLAFGSATTITNICKTLNINSDFLFHDSIQNTSPDFQELIDINFLQNYFKLDSYNKDILNALAIDLVKLQESSNSKEKHS